MNAEPFLADEADDGTPLAGCVGWYCDACGRVYAEKDKAEMCCLLEPDAEVAVPELPSSSTK